MDALQRALKLSKVEAEIIQETFVRQASINYRNKLIRNITSQKYAGKYAPLNPDYKEWKQQKGRADAFWMSTRLLVNSIDMLQLDHKTYLIGPGVNYDIGSAGWFKNSKPRPISKYAVYGEVGHGGNRHGGPQPARPIFGPTRDDFVINVWPKLWKKAMIEILRYFRGKGK